VTPCEDADKDQLEHIALADDHFLDGIEDPQALISRVLKRLH
jgi:hypothetical protein